MNNKSPINQASFTINSFLNLKVCTSILGNLEQNMDLSRKILLWGPSEDPRGPALRGFGVLRHSG